jgi:hypothetical protein
MLLTAAYLENPNDPRLALLLAHTHLWKVSERARLSPVPPEITDHLILAERYFAEARQLAPDDDRIPGWLGSVKLALGTIHRDERVTREGYFMVKEAAATTYRFIKTVPEYATWRYKPALEEQLANLNDWMARLRDADRANDPPYMLNSVIACLGCHAR